MFASTDLKVISTSYRTRANESPKKKVWYVQELMAWFHSNPFHFIPFHSIPFKFSIPIQSIPSHPILYKSYHSISFQSFPRFTQCPLWGKREKAGKSLIQARLGASVIYPFLTLSLLARLAICWFYKQFVARSRWSRGIAVEAHKKLFRELGDIWPCFFTFQIVNNKGADQTARMRRLVCAFVVCKQQSRGFSRWGPYDVETSAWLRAWDPNCLTLDWWYSWNNFFEKNHFEKKQQTTKNH